MRDLRHHLLNKPIGQNRLQRISAILGAVIFIFAAVSPSQSAAPQATHSSSYIISDYIAVDLRTGAEWMRCSVGQIFENNTCTGEAMKLSQDETRQAIKIANKELNGRVPLIGFAGAPWTIFCYMTEGQGSKTFSKARKILYTQWRPASTKPDND